MSECTGVHSSRALGPGQQSLASGSGPGRRQELGPARGEGLGLGLRQREVPTLGQGQGPESQPDVVSGSNLVSDLGSVSASGSAPRPWSGSGPGRVLSSKSPLTESPGLFPYGLLHLGGDEVIRTHSHTLHNCFLSCFFAP